MRSDPRLRGAAALLTLVGAACTGTSLPTRYYVLTPARPADLTEAERGVPAGSGPLIAVVGVQVPEHLARAQIATLRGSNRLELAEFDQWAAPLDRALAGVLAENLAMLVPSERVVSGTRGLRLAPEVEVAVEVTRFDLFEDGRVELAAVCSVRSTEAGERMCSGLYRRQAEGTGYEERVAAMSAAVLDLSRDLAALVRH